MEPAYVQGTLLPAESSPEAVADADDPDAAAADGAEAVGAGEAPRDVRKFLQDTSSCPAPRLEAEGRAGQVEEGEGEGEGAENEEDYLAGAPSAWDFWHPGMASSMAMAYAGYGHASWPGMGMMPPQAYGLGYMDGMAGYGGSHFDGWPCGASPAMFDPWLLSAPADDAEAAVLAAGIALGAAGGAPPTAPPQHSVDDGALRSVPAALGHRHGRQGSSSSKGSATDNVDTTLGRNGGALLAAPPGLSRAHSTPQEAAHPPPMLARAVSLPARPQKPEQPTIVRSDEGSKFCVFWTVDARKLKVKDKVAVSPPFELCKSIPGTFRMMLYPKVVSDRKGGASFKKAKGRGSVHLKCESPDGEVHHGTIGFMFLVSRGHLKEPRESADMEKEEAEELPRGPVRHSFAECGLCSLPKEEEEWDFGKATDEDTQHFVVRLDVLDGGRNAAP